MLSLQLIPGCGEKPKLYGRLGGQRPVEVLRGGVFHRAGAAIMKSYFLAPIRQYLGKRTRNMPNLSDLVG